MKFSVVVPTFNRKSLLRQTLASLLMQEYSDYEIVVVDDGSTDGTHEMLSNEFRSVQCLAQDRCGPAAARNRGIQQSHGEVLAFTDDDCVVPRDWLARLADGYARYPKASGVGGFLQPPDKVLETSALARYETFIAQRVYHVSKQEYFGGFECPAGGTNNMSYRREALDSVGGFDESFACAAGEDADLKYRLCQKGAQLLFLPVRVTHMQSYIWESFKRQAFTRGRGRAQFDAKHSTANRVRSIARLFRRALMLPFDVFDSNAREFIPIRFVEAWQNFRGEWTMLAKAKRWTSST